MSTAVLKDGTQTTTASVPFVFGIAVTTGITTPSTTFAVANTTATTVNAFGAATTLNIGNASGTVNFLGTFVTPKLGTPTSVTLTNATGLPVGGITMNTARLLGRTTASAGVAEEMTVGSGLVLSAGALTATLSLTLLSTVTASASATVDVETTFNSTYDEYVIEVTDLVAATDNVSLNCRLKIGGSYITTATYVYHVETTSSAAATYLGQAAVAGAPATTILLSDAIGNAAGEGASFTMRVSNPAGTTLTKKIATYGASINYAAGEIQKMNVVALNTGTAALTGVRFYVSTGNITSGSFRLYGITKS